MEVEYVRVYNWWHMNRFRKISYAWLWPLLFLNASCDKPNDQPSVVKPEVTIEDQNGLEKMKTLLPWSASSWANRQLPMSYWDTAPKILLPGADRITSAWQMCCQSFPQGNQACLCRWPSLGIRCCSRRNIWTGHHPSSQCNNREATRFDYYY